MQTVIIVNRHAGVMRRDPSLAERMQAACGTHAKLEVTSDEQALVRAAEAAAEAGATTVGVVGGDGTASMTLTALWRAYGSRPLPQIALLRGGTMNTIAASLGTSPRDPLALIERTVRATRNGHHVTSHTRPTMLIGGRLGFLFGTGVWYGYIAESYVGGQPTRLTNATVLARALTSAAIDGPTFQRMRQPRTISVRYEGGTWEPRAYLTIAAGTIADAGFGFRPFPRAGTTTRAFQLLGLKGSPVGVLRAMPGVWFGRGVQAPTGANAQTSWAELEPHDGPFGYSVDGDVATATGTLRIELGPAFRFLRI